MEKKIYVKRYPLANGVTMLQYGMDSCKPCQTVSPYVLSVVGEPISKEEITQDEFFEQMPSNAKIPCFSLEKNGRLVMSLQTSNIIQLGKWIEEAKSNPLLKAL